MSKTEVAVKKENAIAGMDDFASLAGEGFGDTNSSDFVIPRLGLVGDLSPQRKEGNAKYLADAKVGDIIDGALNEILAKGYAGETVHFLPVKRVKEVLEWKPRSAGGGLVSREPLVGRIEDVAKARGANVNDKFEWKLPNNNELIETWQLYGLDLGRDCMPVFVPFKKSNIKVVKPWFTKRANTKFPGTQNALPLLFRTVLLGSFKDSGNGNEWSNWTITESASLPEMGDYKDIKAAAEAFLDILKSGAFVADVDQETSDDDIPF